MKRQVCKRCINDSTVKGIKFNKDGICNYCEAYEKISPRLHDYNSLRELFMQRLENARDKKYDYAAAVGLSGGKDSVYVLYKLSKEYGLKVKAFTLDNGFLSDEAYERINMIITELEIEHEFVRFDEALLKRTYNYFTDKFLSPCIACSFLGYSAMIDYASKVNAAMCVHGRSIPQMLRSYLPDGKDVFIPYIESGLKPISELNLEKLFYGVLEKTERYVDKKLAEEIKNTLMSNALRQGFRELMPFFLYHPYDKNEIIDYITKKTSWRMGSDSEHFDCRIHNATRYLKNTIARRAHIMPDLSVCVRENTLSRDEAIQECQAQIIPCPHDELDYMCNFMNISKNKLLFKAKLYAKRWW